MKRLDLCRSLLAALALTQPGTLCAAENARAVLPRPKDIKAYTDEYLAYLDAAIRDAVRTTGIDGFMLDWLRMPTTRASNGG